MSDQPTTITIPPPPEEHHEEAPLLDHESRLTRLEERLLQTATREELEELARELRSEMEAARTETEQARAAADLAAVAAVQAENELQENLTNENQSESSVEIIPAEPEAEIVEEPVVEQPGRRRLPWWM